MRPMLRIISNLTTGNKNVELDFEHSECTVVCYVKIPFVLDQYIPPVILGSYPSR